MTSTPGSMSPRLTPLLCPRCGYDVAPLIARGVEVCAECGGHIDERYCNPSLWDPVFRAHALRCLGVCVGFGVLAGVCVGLLGAATPGETWLVLGTFFAVIPGAMLVATGAERTADAARARTSDRRVKYVFPLLGGVSLALAGAVFASGVWLMHAATGNL